MITRTDRMNRVLIALIGFLLVTFGVTSSATSFGLFGDEWARQSLVNDRIQGFVTDNATVFWAGVGAAAGVCGLAGLSWLTSQLRMHRCDDIELDTTLTESARHTVISDDAGPPIVVPPGNTLLSPRALTDVITAETERLPEVVRARVRVISDQPIVVMLVWIDDRTDLLASHDRLEKDVLSKARQALGMSTLQTWVYLETASATGQRR